MATWQPVSEQEWERHKDVIQGMYCTENLPLLNRKGNGNEPGVVELMKERHAFIASPSQYELQFKKWGFTKNLKSGEWAALISQYDRLRETTSDVRIIVSGSVLNKNKIDRARRRYRPYLKVTQSAICKGGSLPASRQAYVEFLNGSREWTRYSGSPAKSSTALILRKSSHAGDISLRHENCPKTPRLEIDQSALREEQAVGLVSSESLPDPFTVFRPLSPILDLNEFLASPIFNVDDYLPSSLLPSSSNGNGLSQFSTVHSDPTTLIDPEDIRSSEIDYQQMVVGTGASVTKSRLDGARSLIMSLVQHGKTTLCYKMPPPAESDMPDVEDIMESLESLLPETETPSQECPGLTLSTRNPLPSSDPFKTLFYSFKNNFAGLRDVPRASIMQLIRENPDIRIQLFEIIKGGQSGVAKPLADSFFRAAVEGNDANAVATIIQHTKCNPKIAIDPNDIVCSYEDEEYTPVELAARFRNTELVRTLLAFRADPNKTHKPSDLQKLEQGALGLALGQWDNGSKYPFHPSPPGEPEPVSLCLLKLLLESGAEVRIDLVENAMRPGPGNAAIAEELMSRLPASEHQACFDSEWLLVSAIHYLENSAADVITRRLFTHCSESDNCGECASKNARLIEKLLCHAARRANVELAKFLVQHTTQLQSGLAAAIRASSDELVEFLLNKGARVDGPVTSWDECNHFEDCGLDLYDESGYDRSMFSFEGEHEHYVITPIRTPLAEAIRSRNHHLLSSFRRLGAFTRLSDKHHFHAAVLAAAEVGDTSYLNTVLSYASRHNEARNLTLALAVAVRNDETDTALILLDAGANLDPRKFNRRHGNPLVIALERCNKRVVDYMLECDIRIPGASDANGKSALEAAASWGDIELINDLVRSGAKIDVGVKTTPLGAAVRTRDRNFVSQILDLGADPKAKTNITPGATALQAAMEIGDYDMARFLISRGAPAGDSCAFLYVMSHDPVGYEFLLSEFKKQQPNGLRGFGGQLLAKAIEIGSLPLMESLLGVGVDLNSWCELRSKLLHRSIPTERSHGFYRHRALGCAIRHRQAHNYEMIRALLDGGADTNLIAYEYERPSSSGLIWIRETSLLLAIRSKRLEVVRMLLERGAELNRPARRGVKQTPLQAACETGSYSMVELLLKKGARVNDAAAERYGGTALQLAARSGSLRILRLLLDNGADPFMSKSKVGGRTAFEAAADSGCIDVLCHLWNAVLPLGFSEKECHSAREFAKRKGHRGCADFIDFLSGRSSQSFLD